MCINKVNLTAEWHLWLISYCTKQYYHACGVKMLLSLVTRGPTAHILWITPFGPLQEQSTMVQSLTLDQLKQA